MFLSYFLVNFWPHSLFFLLFSIIIFSYTHQWLTFKAPSPPQSCGAPRLHRLLTVTDGMQLSVQGQGSETTSFSIVTAYSAHLVRALLCQDCLVSVCRQTHTNHCLLRSHNKHMDKKIAETPAFMTHTQFLNCHQCY